MKIGVIGSGKMGLGIGKLWAAKSHKIFYSDVVLKAAQAAARETSKKSKYGVVRECVAFGNILLLSVPYLSIYKALKPLLNDSSINNKIILDCTNPLSKDFKSLLIGYHTSAAEEISELFPKHRHIKVVKALNTIASPVFESGVTSFGKNKATMFYCGDDRGAKRAIAKLIADLGFEPVDAGPLVNARYLEPLAALIIQLAMSQDMGTNIALKLLKR